MRSTLEMCLEVLSTIEHGETKITRIMYRTFLNHRKTKAILARLETRKLITKDTKANKTSRYHITKKGSRIVLYWHKLESLPLPT